MGLFVSLEIDKDAFYTPAEAAGLLGVKEATVKSYCRAGEASGVSMTARKVGPKKEWRLQGSSILRLLAAWS